MFKILPDKSQSLAGVFPAIAKQWHPEKNGSLTADSVLPHSKLKVWWKCHKGPDHEWEAVISNRTNKKQPQGCPCCAGKKVSLTNSLASLHRDIAAQWHPTKNGDLTPDRIVAGSNKKFWWKCENGPDHVWQASPNKRAGAKRGCPFCKGGSVSITNSLGHKYPELIKQWHPTKNAALTPYDVRFGSSRKVWWKCDKAPTTNGLQNPRIVRAATRPVVHIALIRHWLHQILYW